MVIDGDDDEHEDEWWILDDVWWMMTPASKNSTPFDFWMNPGATGSDFRAWRPSWLNLKCQAFSRLENVGNGTQNVFIAKIQLVFQESNYAKYEIQKGSWGTKGIKNILQSLNLERLCSKFWEQKGHWLTDSEVSK